MKKLYINETFDNSFSDNEFDYTDLMDQSDNDVKREQIKKWLLLYCKELYEDWTEYIDDYKELNFNSNGNIVYWKMIPNDINMWLTKHGFEINDDLSIDVSGNCSIRVAESFWKHNERFEIPSYIQFNKVTGDFDISNLNLLSLRGCPKKVYGTFNCSDNELHNLEFGPEESDRYICNFNNFEKTYDVIDYAPKYVGSAFSCHQETFSRAGKEFIGNTLYDKWNGETTIFMGNGMIWRSKYEKYDTVNEGFDSYDDNTDDYSSVFDNMDYSSFKQHIKVKLEEWYKNALFHTNINYMSSDYNMYWLLKAYYIPYDSDTDTIERKNATENSNAIKSKHDSNEILLNFNNEENKYYITQLFDNIYMIMPSLILYIKPDQKKWDSALHKWWCKEFTEGRVQEEDSIPGTIVKIEYESNPVYIYKDGSLIIDKKEKSVNMSTIKHIVNECINEILLNRYVDSIHDLSPYEE